MNVVAEQVEDGGTWGIFLVQENVKEYVADRYDSPSLDLIAHAAILQLSQKAAVFARMVGTDSKRLSRRVG